MGQAEEIKRLEEEMMQCSMNVWKEIEQLKNALAEQSAQRTQYNTETNRKLDQLAEWFDGHDSKEMTKYDEIVSSIKDLTEAMNKVVVQTEDNTDFIDTIKKYWGRALVAATTAASILGGLYWLYTFLQKHGLVIVFEKGAGG